ncbi:MAG: hypothetical protein HOO93_00720 [Methyloglobulus sp.]|nr:hypothetical protein [Methyloglobulus sp.]
MINIRDFPPIHITILWVLPHRRQHARAEYGSAFSTGKPHTIVNNAIASLPRVTAGIW